MFCCQLFPSLSCQPSWALSFLRSLGHSNKQGRQNPFPEETHIPAGDTDNPQVISKQISQTEMPARGERVQPVMQKNGGRGGGGGDPA